MTFLIPKQWILMTSGEEKDFPYETLMCFFFFFFFFKVMTNFFPNFLSNATKLEHILVVQLWF